MTKETIELILGYDLGDKLHDEWRKNLSSSNEDDIVNKDFEELSKDLQNENLQAGIVAIDLVYDLVMEEKDITKELIEELSSKVHNAWMKRNKEELKEENNIQGNSYKDLPEEEKEKDRNHILKAISKVEDYKKGKVDLEEQRKKYNL